MKEEKFNPEYDSKPEPKIISEKKIEITLIEYDDNTSHISVNKGDVDIFTVIGIFESLLRKLYK